jgi:hypothetical protein
MARTKMRASWLIESAAWSGIAVATLAGAYTVSGLIAHCGTYISWR